MKKNFLVLFAAVAMASCSSSDDVVTPDNGERADIKLTSTIYEVNATRAVMTSANTEFSARVLASETSGDYSGIPLADGTIDFNGSTTVGFTPAVKYPDATSSVYLVGLFPATTWNKEDDKLEHAINGTADIMVTDEAPTTETEAVAGAYPNLEFNHLLTKLDIKVISWSAAAAAAFGNVSSIIVDSPNGKVVFNPADMAISYEGGSAPITVDGSYPIALASEDPKHEFNGGYAMVAPVDEVTEDHYTLTIVTTDGGSITKPVTLKSSSNADFTGNTTGKSFTITLTFKSSKDVGVTGEIADWTPEGNSNVDIEE